MAQSNLPNITALDISVRPPASPHDLGGIELIVRFDDGKPQNHHRDLDQTSIRTVDSLVSRIGQILKELQEAHGEQE